MTNAQLIYLLGMIVGKGMIKRGNTETTIIIEIPHKLLQIEGYDVELSVKASLEDIRSVIQPLIGVNLTSTSQKSKTILQFSKSNEDFLIREINRHLGNLTSWQKFRIPSDVMCGSKDMKKEFMIGLADVTAHIRQSNIAYGIKYHNRVYIEIPKNWDLVIDIANLLKSLDIPIHVINWGHPNMRDSSLKDYKKGNNNASFREHQVKIFAEEFSPIGFRIAHKNQVLTKLSDLNQKEWEKHVQNQIDNASNDETKQKFESQLNELNKEHHRFYWNIKSSNKIKPPHPLEADDRIPEKIRGMHFNSWKDICHKLGYSE